MSISLPVQAIAACAPINATRLGAQVQIVRSFGVHPGGGPEPSDDQLIHFARLAVSEMRLQRRLVAISSAHDGRVAVGRER